jgi:hypothetical protein
MDEFKEKFVDVTRIAYSGTKKGEVTGFEGWMVPVMDVAAFVEKGFLGCGFTNVMFIVAGDGGSTDICLPFVVTAYLINLTLKALSSLSWSFTTCFNTVFS